MKDGVGNEILVGDILHVTLNSENVIAKVVEVTGGMVVDPQTRKVKPESVRVLIDITLKCPYEGLPTQFLPEAFKIHNPAKEQEEKKKTEEVLTTVESGKTTPPLPKTATMFLKRPSDIKDEKLNPTK
jgi:hypothetical protein